MSPFLSFVRRLGPVDLLLPIGAGLVAAGLQNLVDREDRQRRRLAALDELVDVHRTALTAAGVTLPADLVGDEHHPLDIENAIGIIVGRSPADPAPADPPKPRGTRRRVLLAASGLIGLAAGGMWAHSAGWLDGFNALADTNRRIREADDDYAAAAFRGDVDPATGEQDNATTDAISATLETPEPEPLGELAPFESCCWTGCDWTSDPTRSQLSQSTAAAVHQNRCVLRPAGAGVPE